MAGGGGQWEALLVDPITITIDGDFADLGPGTLGSTVVSLGSLPYDTARGVLVADAAAEGADAFNADDRWMPTNTPIFNSRRRTEVVRQSGLLKYYHRVAA